MVHHHSQLLQGTGAVSGGRERCDEGRGMETDVKSISLYVSMASTPFPVFVLISIWLDIHVLSIPHIHGIRRELEPQNEARPSNGPERKTCNSFWDSS